MAASPRTPRLDIIIVNWNAGPQIAECVKSIAAADTHGLSLDRVVIVDNGSTDGSADLTAPRGLRLEVMRNRENRGFAAACNQGAARSSADYLLFLNPDTLLAADSLAVPITFLEQPDHQRVALAGIQLVDDEGHIARSCARRPTPAMFAAKMTGIDRLSGGRVRTHIMSDWSHDSTRVVDHVIGAFYLVRRRVFEALHGFDERFFVYLEDVDLSMRIRDAGWDVVYLAGVRAYHKGGGVSSRAMSARLAYSLHSRILYGAKHFSPIAAAGLAAGTLVLEPLIRAVDALARRRPGELEPMLRGFGMLWRRLLSGSFRPT
jgi:N-acetylglucosaminyl-diphospho-decaprenol L-rhamnosyltransferase